MYRITDRNGKVFYAKTYRLAGDNIVIDDSTIISGGASSFTIVDLDAPAKPDPAQWLIDIGPFFDRFGAAKLAVLSSTDPAVRAIVQDVSVRKWVDLTKPSVAQGIDLLIAIGVPGVDTYLKNSILTTPVSELENLAVKTLFFNKG